MEVSKELTLVEKKKLVLDKIDTVLQTFLEIKKTLLGILETNKYLDASDKLRERQNILRQTSEQVKDLMIDIEKIKAANIHRPNEEVQEAHEKIAVNVYSTIDSIVDETKIRTIITISSTLQELVTGLSKNIKTGIGLEYLVLSDRKKFSEIRKPIDLEIIRTQIGKQIKNIDHRITDISGILKLIEYLDLQEGTPVLSELLDYILGGKNYDEIKHILDAQGIYIEEITIQSNLPGDDPVLPSPPVKTPVIKEAPVKLPEPPISEERPQKTADTHVEFIPITPENAGFFGKLFKMFGFGK